ncbi:MRN complex-interacting protein [Senna tora]|uniref:MRN complex-interacting protein n=1 Tax=Senna tora TaxID=362788 RepID=A0A834SYN8_9FABA|nr:MRN complex-interacting protein [Senna tora]
MSSTIFIALQCCQCLTMQVKQKKKSSNKWNCVVCNQKQSVRKVFAQGFMAKDIRSFVQSFNMSRKSLDEQSHFAENLVSSLEEENKTDEDNNFKLPINQKKKRSDWTEYLDPEDHRNEEQGDLEENGDCFETKVKVVTELEKSMFKKPRLENYSTTLGTVGRVKLCKPRFSKRNNKKEVISQDAEEPVKDQITLKENNTKWDNNYTTPDNERPQRCQPTINRANSKWNDYITEEDDRSENGWKRAFEDNADPWNNSVLEAVINEQRVEDDVHPDFM